MIMDRDNEYIRFDWAMKHTLWPKDNRVWDAHIDKIMMQNNVLNPAREEGYFKGYFEGYCEGYFEGFAKGIAKGKEEMMRGIVLNMLKQGLSPDMIRTLTGVDLKYIESLKND